MLELLVFFLQPKTNIVLSSSRSFIKLSISSNGVDKSASQKPYKSVLLCLTDSKKPCRIASALP